MKPRTLKYTSRKKPTYKSFAEGYFAELNILTDDPENKDIPYDALEARAAARAAKVIQQDRKVTELKSVEVVSTREETAQRVTIEGQESFIDWVEIETA